MISPSTCERFISGFAAANSEKTETFVRRCTLTTSGAPASQGLVKSVVGQRGRLGLRHRVRSTRACLGGRKHGDSRGIGEIGRSLRRGHSRAMGSAASTRVSRFHGAGYGR